MHKCYLLFPILSSVFLPSGFFDPDIIFFSDDFGPLEYANNDFDLNFKITAKNKDIKGYVQCDGFYNGKKMFTSKSSSVDLYKGQSSNLNVKICTKDYLTYEGLDIKTSFIDTKSSVTYTAFLQKILPYKSQTFNPIKEDYNNKLNPTVFSLGRSIEYSKKESFDFSDCQEYFLRDQYLKLDLSQFTFRYNHVHDLTYSSASFVIRDIYDCFDYISKDENKEFSIPLKIFKRNSKMLMSFLKTMYVNEKTLQMSLIPRDGFKETSSFFFPINKQQEVMKDEFKMSLIGLGDNKTNFIWNCSMNTVTNFLGDCSNSEYCIIGGVKK